MLLSFRKNSEEDQINHQEDDFDFDSNDDTNTSNEYIYEQNEDDLKEMNHTTSFHI